LDLFMGIYAVRLLVLYPLKGEQWGKRLATGVGPASPNGRKRFRKTG
jgi:hypothetical protein